MVGENTLEMSIQLTTGQQYSVGSNSTCNE